MSTQTLIDVGTHANSTNGRQLHREQAYRLHAVFNRVSSTSSGANCDRSPRGGENGVPLRKIHTKKGTRASFAKQSCGCRFCPRCSPKQSFMDRTRLALAVEQHIKDGGTTLFITLTAQTRMSTTPKFANAEYTFRRDQEAFTNFRNADKDLPRRGAKARLKAAAEAYGEEHGIPTDTHTAWELADRFNDFRTVLSRSVFEGQAWRADQERFGVKGRVDAVELVPQPALKADGSKDWNRVRHNLHFHVVVFISKRLNSVDRELLVNNLRNRWVKSLKNKGYRASNNAQDFSWIAADDVSRVIHYITKFSDEVLFGKKTGKESLSVWDALKDASGGHIVDGRLVYADPAARNWFRQVEQVFSGRRMLNTSTGFFNKMGVADLIKQKEEEFRANSIMETVLTFTGGVWQLLHEDNPELKYELLNVAENTTNEELYEFVTRTGYEFTKPMALTLDDLPDDVVAESEVWDQTPF